MTKDEGVIPGEPTEALSKSNTQKRKPHSNYKFIGYQQRIDVIYDNFIHDKQPIDISNIRDLKYNTIRSILQNFYQNGRINVKKKISGYVKGANREAVAKAPDNQF